MMTATVTSTQDANQLNFLLVLYNLFSQGLIYGGSSILWRGKVSKSDVVPICSTFLPH